jgi:hypothetical protein
MKLIAYRILAGLMCLALLGLSFFLSEAGFRQVLEFRSLERIPLSLIEESVGGETQIRGWVGQKDDYLTAPKTEKACVYYRYLVEREETDSDGDTSWRTVTDEEKAVDFIVEDHSGTAPVFARTARGSIHWSIAQKYRQRFGDYRYTEWRIDPRDRVTIFGWLEHSPALGIRFPFTNHYSPIVSSFTAADERGDIAFAAIMTMWGGLTVLIAACYCLVYVLRIHRTIVFLVILSVTGSLMLIHYGYRSVESDVVNGFDRVHQHASRAEKLINQVLESNGLLPMRLTTPFDTRSLAYAEVDEADKRRVNTWRRSSFQVRERFINQIDRFPDRWVAKSMGFDQPLLVALPPAELERIHSEDSGFQATRTSTSVLWILALILLTGGASWISFRVIRTKRMQENIPTSKSAGVVFGLAEVKGELVADSSTELLIGPVSSQKCSWYHYKVEELRGSGKRRSWHVISDEVVKHPFYCKDEEGVIRVFPGKADCISNHLEIERKGNRRYTERRLSPGDQLYILGKARLDKTSGDTLVFGHEQDSPYIIANISEEEVMMRKAMKGLGLMALALSALFMGAMLIVGNNGQLSSLDFLFASLVAPVFMLFVVFAIMYNDLIFLRQRCDRNWANIQVSLKKRSNLVPQLEQVVKQYLQHESELHEQLVQLRERRRAVKDAGEFDEYMHLEHSLIDGINLRVEQYPELKGIDLIAVFNRRLTKLENEIALIRTGFNDAVEHYETRRSSFPDNLLAKLSGMAPVNLLQYTEKAHRIPTLVRLTD